MSSFARALLVLMLLFAGSVSGRVLAQEAQTDKQDEAVDPSVVLDTAGFWRMHYTFKLPMLLREGKTVGLAEVATKGYIRPPAWLRHDTAFPPKDWMASGFDDSSWERLCGTLVSTMVGWGQQSDSKSPYMALECARGKFAVNDPDRVGDLSFTAEYRGGIVVWLNGERVAQSHMQQEGTGGVGELAQPTQPDEAFPRRAAVSIPAGHLRKGVNVLAVEVHRAPLREKEIILNNDKWPQGVIIPRAPCGLESVRLSAPGAAPGSIVANVTRPKGFQVWNGSALAMDFDMDFGDPNETLKPIRIVGTRGGAFSGKAVVGSDVEIKGLRATVGELKQTDGDGRIPAGAVEVRYGRPLGYDLAANFRYLGGADRLEALDDAAPEVVEAREKAPIVTQEWVGEGRQRRRETKTISLVSPGVKPVFGAVCPVWVTVTVPADAKPGEYAGVLTISADGVEPVDAPVHLTVCGWRLPDAKDWQTFADIIQSPETLAMAYDVPLWSKEHFGLIERSLRELGRTGAKTVYIRMICDTNLGNAQTIVRWMPRDDGTYHITFAAFDRYMELVRKYLGSRTVVVLYVWDKFLERAASRGQWEGEGQKKAIEELEGKGPEVTQIDPEGGVSRLQLPPYADPNARTLWKPVSDGIRERMAKWGMSDSLMLGVMCDYMPSERTFKDLAEIYPGVRWVSQAHPMPHKSVAEHVGYASNVFSSAEYDDPSVRRLYGWKSPALRTHYWRLTRNDWPITTFRYMAEMSLMRGERGFARMGGDFFPVLQDKRGNVVGSLAARYVKSYWNNLNIEIHLIARGAKGPVATARLDAMREGMQHCEARIFIERALTDETLRAKLGDDLALRCQDILDERARAIRLALCSYVASGHYQNWATYSSWQGPAVFGSHWYIGSGWEGRSRKLFDAAAEVAAKLDQR